MVKFYTTSGFRAFIELYLKKDNGYNNCKGDLCSFFSGKTIDDIVELPTLVSPSQNLSFKKSRIINSLSGKGKSSGYRLYYFVDVKNESVFLLAIYPKTGKYRRDDLSDTETKIMIKNFAKERKEDALIEHHIERELAVLEV